MAIIEISIVPIGGGSTSVSKYVAACHRELKKNRAGLHYELTAMGTIIEGDLDDILRVVRRLHEAPFQIGAKRVSTLIKIDDRRDHAGTMADKVKSVIDKLHR